VCAAARCFPRLPLAATVRALWGWLRRAGGEGGVGGETLGSGGRGALLGFALGGEVGSWRAAPASAASPVPSVSRPSPRIPRAAGGGGARGAEGRAAEADRGRLRRAEAGPGGGGRERRRRRLLDSAARRLEQIACRRAELLELLVRDAPLVQPRLTHRAGEPTGQAPPLRRGREGRGERATARRSGFSDHQRRACEAEAGRRRERTMLDAAECVH